LKVPGALPIFLSNSWQVGISFVLLKTTTTSKQQQNPLFFMPPNLYTLVKAFFYTVSFTGVYLIRATKR
jgi:hypothetical protein